MDWCTMQYDYKVAIIGRKVYIDYVFLIGIFSYLYIGTKGSSKKTFFVRSRIYWFGCNKKNELRGYWSKIY